MIYAHEWMNDAHVHEMQVQLGKTNTRGVTLTNNMVLIDVASFNFARGLKNIKDIREHRQWAFKTYIRNFTYRFKGSGLYINYTPPS